ncbi:nucleoprotein [Caligus rogercresseyi rhabdovirus]|uniref:Nucleoprotein n=1 Tax=Caligus rogercresseyi rhabdovirus TaxID=1921414 RepID=A0A1L2YZU9_9RHAB|nr:nucleoprotein [Caligus rogercresseyi rhabdovirus]APF32073.1 nucleoprotein [Caligus rogercresseyi rhabdovirus]|eukprot:TRINITY_DN21896_c0_g1_i1.p1 TRINITY_DN21896_c0_g1~~TRINITY_DN21896_c0_g1_i1.p1  ORF type:complete len:463 (+),score=-6.14 TRINITY_DN21896_c0_g1_i1:33-1391(+)
MDDDIIHFKTGKVFNLLAPVENLPTQYPATWFQQEKKKPYLTLRLPQSLIAEPARIVALLEAQMQIGRVTPDVLAFGYKFLLDREVLTRDGPAWVSFDQQITHENKDRLDGILTMTMQAEDGLEMKEGKPTLVDTLYVNLVVCGAIVRRDRVANVAGKDRITQIVTRAVQSSMGIDISGYLGSVQVTTNATTTKIMAAVDMYLYNRRDSMYGFLRLGTVCTRYRDCTVLSEFVLLEDLSQTKCKEAISWILSPIVSDELISTMEPGQETHSVGSYMPYMMDLQLSTRSPYSTSENPKYHTWIHIVGTLLHKDRCRKAAVIEEALIGRLFKGAALAAYRWTESDEVVQVFGRMRDKVIEESAAEIRRSQLEANFLDGTDPEEDSPGAYADWARDEYPRKLFQFIDNTLNGQFMVIRKGSMGDFVRNHWAGHRDSLVPEKFELPPWNGSIFPNA